MSLFVCVSSSLSVVKDDDYCDDTINGADEMQSSACSGIASSPNLFKCKGGSLMKQLVFTSRVNDGVCDCCDGTDESTSGVTCINECAALEAGANARIQARESIRQRGLQLQAASLAEARVELADLRQAQQREALDLPELNREIAEKEQALEDLKRVIGIRLEEHVNEAAVTYEVNVKKLFGSADSSVLKKLIAAIVLRSNEDVGDYILKAAQSRYVSAGAAPDDAQILVLTLETPRDTDLSVGLYAPPTTDADTSSKVTQLAPPGIADRVNAEEGQQQQHRNLAHWRESVLLADDSLALMGEALSLTRLDRTGLLQVLNTAMSAAHHLNVLALCILDAKFVPMGDPQNAEHTHIAVQHAVRIVLEQLPASPKMVRDRASLLAPDPSLAIMEESVVAARAERDRLKERSKASQEVLRFDYGPDDYLFVLQGACASATEKTYRYSACPFRQAHQGNTLLGTYKGVEKRRNAQTGEEETWMTFTGGAYCHATRRPREMAVRLECSEHKAELSAVEEYEVCMYKAELRTFAACEPIASIAKEHARSEL